MQIRNSIKILVIVWMLGMLCHAAKLPAGTRITVRTASTISSADAQSGQRVDGTVARNVVVNGRTVVKAGTPVSIRVVTAKSSGRLKAPGILRVRLASVGGQAVTTTSIYRKGKSHTKSNVTKIGGGAAAGALIGGLAGGGKGAGIGALVGGGAGTGLAAATGKQEAVFPAETVMTFTVQ